MQCETSVPKCIRAAEPSVCSFKKENFNEELKGKQKIFILQSKDKQTRRGNGMVC